MCVTRQQKREQMTCSRHRRPPLAQAHLPELDELGRVEKLCVPDQVLDLHRAAPEGAGHRRAATERWGSGRGSREAGRGEKKKAPLAA